MADWHRIHYDAVESTQRVAAVLAVTGVPNRTVVIAARQTAGVGRKGDLWRDLPNASLLCTAIVRPPWPRSAPIACYGMAMAVAVIEAIRELSGGTATIKWPNDVLLGRGKVAGILGDATWIGQTLNALRLGVGVNVGGTRDEFIAGELPDATSIEAETRYAVTVEEMLSALLARFASWDDLLSVGQWQAVVAAWRAEVATVGQQVADNGDLLLTLSGERKPLVLAASAVQSLRSL